MRRDPCTTCGHETVYSAKYDRFACPSCKVWTEPPCGCSEAECPFTKSPEAPTDEILAAAEVV